MAFNPFHSFRKHQKVIFAVLTIACMFIFVLQFGTGDFFQRAKGWFGGGKGQGEFVAKVDGTKVYAGDLAKWARQRDMTNTFLAYLRYNAIQAIATDPRGRSDKIDPRIPMLQRFLTMSDEEIRRLPQEQQFTFFTGPQIVESLQKELKDKPGREDDAKFLGELANALKIRPLLRFATFGGSKSNDDLLDFELWKHQADKLGIVLTPTAVRQLVQQDTAGRNVLPEGSFMANEQFQRSMGDFAKRFGGVFSETQILDALADEYRVIMAQQALLGQALSYQGASGMFSAPNEWSPVTFTPGEYQQYFREQRTTIKVALLPIPVEDFTKDVTATPTPKQLRDLFDLYKNKEPAPAQVSPGFTEPRSVRVQYLSVNPKSEFYQNLAKKFFVPSTAMTAAKLAIARQVLAGSSLFATGGGASAWALTVGTPLANDPVLQEYGQYFGHFQHSSDDVKRGVATGDKVAPDIYDPSFDAASALGHILGGLAQGNPAAAPAAIANTNRVHTQARARGVGAAILAGTSPTPGLGSDLQTVTNFVQPMNQMDAYLTEQTRDHMAQAFAILNLRRFIKEVEAQRSNPPEAKQTIERLAKESDFHLETMATAQDQWSIADDPALKNLRAAFATRTHSPITTAAEFASEVTRPQGVFQLSTPFQNQFDPNGPPEMIPNAVMASDQQIFLYWLIEDNPPRVRSFDEAKSDVIAAWKRAEARKLARKRAEEIEAAIRKQTWPEDDTTRQREVEAFLNAQNYGKAFVLSKIARQVEVDSPNPDRPKEYKAYSPEETAIQYPPTNFAESMLSLQKPGDTTYVLNRPETTVYVAVLLARTEPTYDDFKRSFERASEAVGADSLWTSFVQTRREEFRKRFMEKMREEAAPEQTVNGKWNLPKNLNPRSGQRGSSDEE